MSADSRQLAGGRRAVQDEVRRIVLAQGFDRVGFAACGPAPDAAHLRRWVERGFAGSMGYLERTLEKRADPRLVLEGARSVMAVALHYPGPGAAPTGGERGRIAAYARGDDYHRLMETRLRAACEALGRSHAARYRYYVDTGPVLERSWAQEAGIGWIGKNACAIDAAAGSYFFIGVILTTLELEPDVPGEDRCGACTLCIDACPTGAIVAPREIDARLCLSYLTIEHRGGMPGEIEPLASNLVFGCDICQETCPFNRADAEGDPALLPRAENVDPDLEELVSLDEEGFRTRFPRSAVRRAGAPGFLRNAIVSLGNSGTPRATGILRKLLERESVRLDPVLRASAERAVLRCEEAAAAS